MKQLLADIAAIRRAYYADHTIGGDVAIIVVAALAAVVPIGLADLILDGLEKIHG